MGHHSLSKEKEDPIKSIPTWQKMNYQIIA
jgi:hypothetical protein